MRRLWLSLVALLGGTLVLLGADSPGIFDKVGHQLVCQCGCNQILLECNHVGCPVSPVMIRELHTQLASGLPLTGVYNWFISKYGAIVLAAPIRGGFDTLAWVVPFGVLVCGTFGVAFLVKYWLRRHKVPAFPEATPVGPESDQLRARIRQETGFD